MIDPRKSIAIFTYPRSGSTWFQDKLTHYNLQEMMNYNVKFKFTRTGMEFDRAYWIERPPLEQILKYRVEMLRFYHRNNAPVSLKLQTRYMKPEIKAVLKELDFQYIALERRDRLATVLSFLIVVYTDEWGGKTTPREITIQRNMFDYVMEVLCGFEHQLEELKQEFPIQTVYFEDSLGWEPCEWWKTDSRITVQNAKSITTITNREQVDEWIRESGYL